MAQTRQDLAHFLDLSDTLIRTGRFGEALRLCEAGSLLYPDDPGLMGNQAAAAGYLGHYQRSLDLFLAQASLLPEQPQTLRNIGQALMNLGRTAEARESFARALALDPDDPVSRFNLSFALLIDGEYREGFRLFESRRSRHYARERQAPDWDGSPLNGEQILLFADQGLGDAIQCARYISFVERSGGAPVLEVQQPLIRLLSWLPGNHILRAPSSEPGTVQRQAALFSLPFLARTEVNTIPPPQPFAVPGGLRIRWAQIFGSLSGRRVAVAWAGNPEFQSDQTRSLHLRALAPLLQTAGIHCLSIQKGYATGQIAELGWQDSIVDLSPAIEDMGDTAAILSQVDLVITSDTSVAHLAGNQGIPTWLLLSSAPDWRWMLGRDDSPWYPSMRLFRQSTPGDWTGVIERVVAALAQLPSVQRSPLAQLTADWIPSTAKVLEFHAGAPILQQHLTAGQTYEACDITTEELPAVTDAAYVSLLAILDRVEDWRGLLRYLRHLGRPLTLSYHPTDTTTDEDRMRLGCANHLSLVELSIALSEIGFEIVDSAPVDAGHALFHLMPSVLPAIGK